jgi:hypothetical protein
MVSFAWLLHTRSLGLGDAQARFTPRADREPPLWNYVRSQLDQNGFRREDKLQLTNHTIDPRYSKELAK